MSRRRALRWIGGAVAGALLARFPGAATAASAPILGLIDFDKSSYLRMAPAWKPEPPIAREPGLFKMGDLLEFAGVAK